MSRRVVGALAVTGGLLGVPQSSADTPPPPQMPTATCTTRTTDGPGDGIPTFGVDNVNNVPTVPDPRGNVGALDIAAITLRLTDTRVYAFMSVADIPDAFREPDSAYGYIMWFTRGAKIARFDHVHVNPTHAQRGLAPTSGYPAASVGTTTSGGTPLTGVGGGVDPAKNVVYVYADRSSLETQLGEPLVDGAELTAINGRTELWETDGRAAPGVVRRPADKTDPAAASAVWKVGDDRCFAASSITVADVSAQYGDVVTLTATLANDAGAPLANRKVAVTVPGEEQPRTLTTDAAGAVSVVLDSAPAAGTYPIAVAYRGDDFSGSGTGAGALTVQAETIRMAALKVTKSKTTARTVTVTLTEDDPRAFAKQPVAWYVNGKKVATLLTDASGRSVFSGAKAGQKVQARYVGETGHYAAATSNTVTA